MKMNQKFHKGDGHPLTTLDVEQMKFSRDDMLNAQVWLEEFVLGDTQDAAHARAVYSFSTAMATAILKQSSHPVDSGSDSVAPAAAADSAPVETGSETLDPGVTEAAIDREQRITRKADDSVAEPTSKKQFSRLLPTHETAATLGTIEHPSRHLVGNAMATLVEALPEERVRTTEL